MDFFHLFDRRLPAKWWPGSRVSMVLAAFSLVLASCGGGEDEKGLCDDLLPGDLVISEFMHNLPTEERGSGQWFEVYNASKKSISLEGLSIYRAQHSGAGRKSERLNKGKIAAGEFYVFGNASEDSKPEWVDYAYEDRLGNLNLTQGRLGIMCGSKVLDEVIYVGKGSSNKSRVFDGSIPPDAAANDDMARWCDSSTEFAPGLFGTPGKSNDSCEPVVVDPNICLDPESGKERKVRYPAPGELVITELLPSVNAVADTAGEWVELHALQDVDLNGLSLKNEGKGSTTFSSAYCLPISAGDYVVLARNANPEENGGIAEVLATFNFSLANTGDRAVSLWKDEELIDQADYKGSTKGVSWQLGEKSEEDPELEWCLTPEGFSYGDGDRGTPGQANPRCDQSQSVDPGAATCVENGVERDVVFPSPGDLQITEFMANSNAVTDTYGEWVEIYAHRAVDLNGSTLRNEGTGKTTFEAEECLHIAEGSHAVLAKNSDPLQNGGIEDVLATFSLALANTSARSIAVYVGDELIDQADYEGVTKGVSYQLGQKSADDPELEWCLTPEGFTYGAGDRGTPGLANPPCDDSQSVEPGGATCVEDGVERDVVFPAPGDLQITEFMANSSAVTDTYGEWVEIYAHKAVDLNGSSLRNEGTGKTTFESEECLHIAEGSYAVLAKNSDPQQNGGIEDVLATFSLTLANTNERSLALYLGEELIDQADYKGVTKGVSYQLGQKSAEDPELEWCLTPEGFNYGDGDRGTPGQANPRCDESLPMEPVMATCLEDGSEREVVFPAPGDLQITEFLPSSAAVTDANGEWVELYAHKAVDLNGSTLRNEGTGKTTFEAEECLHIPAGSYAVLAKNAKPQENGGIEGVLATFTVSLANTNERSVSLYVEEQLIDKVDYNGTAKGVSYQLAEKSWSDSDTDWCLAPAGFTYGDGDRGTPGDPNPRCDGTVPGEPVEGTCEDPETGKLREIAGPAPGDLIITELHPQPSLGVLAQYVEVQVLSEVDLNGVSLLIGDQEAYLEESETCLPAEAGSFLLFAGSDNPAENDSLVNVHAVLGVQLPVSDGEVSLVSESLEIDSVHYESSEEGVALQLGESPEDPAERVWCATPEAVDYGSGDRGSPGEANPACESEVLIPGAGECIDPDTQQIRQIVAPSANDLTITELHPQPSLGAAAQYVEVQIVGEVDLNGVALLIGSEQAYLFASETCLSAEAGSYLLFAGSEDSVENDQLPEVTGLLAVGLPPSNGEVSLVAGSLEIDAVVYDSSEEGIALQLGESAEDPPQLEWCETPETSIYGSGDRGSPGTANPACESEVLIPELGECIDPDTQQIRQIVAPAANDLSITEIHPQPSLGVLAQYVEVQVLSEVDLNGVALLIGGQEAHLFESETCLPFEAGSFLLYAGSDDPAENGELSADAVLGALLPVSDGDVSLISGAVSIDSAFYESSEEGVALQLGESAEEPFELLWCLTPEGHVYESGDRGTPGSANPQCPVAGGEPDPDPEALCLDGGIERPVVWPDEGQLMLSEIQAWPAAPAGDEAQWLELYAAADFDLNGLQLGVGEDVEAIESEECLRVSAGSHLLIAASLDSEDNGLPFVSALLPTSLPHSGTLRLLAGELELDSVNYTASQGTTFQLAATSEQDPTLLWCETPESLICGGSPGSDNPPCSFAGSEPEGSLCLDCSLRRQRQVVSPEVGDLWFSEVMPDPAAVNDNVGEYIELYADKGVDLNGVEVKFSGSATPMRFSGNECLRLGAGSYGVIARSADPVDNGGIPGVLATFSFTLTNTGERSLDLYSDDELIDSMTYVGSKAGVSWQLARQSAGIPIYEWCYTPEHRMYGMGDKGTPGEENPPCDEVAVVAPTCLEDGQLREVNLPQPGDLLITEFLAQPTVNDSHGEYIEIYATRKVDLNGVMIASQARNQSSPRALTTGNNCVSLDVDEYALLVRSNNPDLNGGLPTGIRTFAFGLNNTSGKVQLLLDDDENDEEKTVINSIDYSPEHVVEGVALQLDPNYYGLAASENLANWCLTPYGIDFEGEIGAPENPQPVSTRGTPGAENVSCPPPPSGPACFDEERKEVREIVSPQLGDLMLTEFLAWPEDGVPTSQGQWVELYSYVDADLNGLELRLDDRPEAGDGASVRSVFESESCLKMTADKHVVVGRSTSAWTEVLSTFTFTIPVEATPELGLSIWLDDQRLDALEGLPASSEGVSYQLDLFSYGHMNGSEEPIWCESPDFLVTRYSPGAVNELCPF